MSNDFTTALADYLKQVNETSSERFKTEFSNLYGTPLQPIYRAYEGKKWIKVVREDAAQKSVFCFINPQTGDLYKPATWNAPAKGIRGNIYHDKKPITSGQFYR